MPILLVAATDFEMRAFANASGPFDCTLQLIAGIGPAETVLSLSSFLHRSPEKIDFILNFGIAGAYPDSSAGLLDVCMAEEEVFGDLGICLEDRIERFAQQGLTVRDCFAADAALQSSAASALTAAGIACRQGRFVTVNCASGTWSRAALLGRQLRGLCENMEGAAVARVCEHFSLPWIEVRCISNFAGERNKKNWRLREACSRAGQAAAACLRATE